MSSPAAEKRGGNLAEDNRTKDKSGLTGWAGIEDHLFTYDEGKTKGYSDDIDTLLVFAGLFSAILTAFVVQTYPQLQPDSSVTTNELLATTNQLLIQGLIPHGTSFHIPPILNSTMSSILDSQPFTPPVSAHWINALFFVSLVLSLAAALFGILAKQWLREYMQWNSPLATPRENVIIRQFRFEAWESWNVAATIATVPALLEIAMIFFLAGLVILLWTLDDIVAIVVTVVVAVFLAVVSTFTVLPIFARRCPYKSPTAWALVTVFHGTGSTFLFTLRYLVGFAKLLDRRWTFLSDHYYAGSPTKSQTRPSIFKRLRELCTGIWVGCLNSNCQSFEVARPPALESWRNFDLQYCRSMPDPVHSLGSKASKQPADMAEARLSLRALWWVSRSSQDTRVAGYIRQCQLLPSYPCDTNVLVERSAYLVDDVSISRKRLYRLVAGDLDTVLALGVADSSNILLNAFDVACRIGKVIIRPENKALGVIPGRMTEFDYEALLLSYMNNYADSSDAYLNILVLTSVQWLHNTKIPSVSLATVSNILEKMVSAAEAISCRGRHNTHGCKDAEDEEWILQLWWSVRTLSESYGQLFRRLLHIFETSYHRGVLVGDQDEIRLRLHDCLKRAHGRRTCEIDGCPWLAHTCDGTEESDYEECPLLGNGEESVTGKNPVVLSPQQDGGLDIDASLTQTPDPAAWPERSPEDTRSQDLDDAIIKPSTLPSLYTRDQEPISSLPMTNDGARDTSTSVHSPDTASGTPAAAFQAPPSLTSLPVPVFDAAPHSLSLDRTDSIAICISPSLHCPPAAGESRMGVQDASSRDVAALEPEADAAFPSANALPMQQHETAPLAATTETVSAGSLGAAHGTPNKADTPDTVVSQPAIPAPLSVLSAPQVTSTLDTQPSALLGGHLLDPTGPSSVETRCPAIVAVNCSYSGCESSQDSLTSYFVTVDEPSREGQAQDAEQEETPGPHRQLEASRLFRGVRAVSRQSSEEFELAVRDGKTGRDSG